MNDLLKAIEEGRGMLTDEERAALEEYADSTGASKVLWQVYDDSNVTDGDYLGTVEVGERHATYEEAVDWAENRVEQDPSFTRCSIYRMRRCVTRKREIWYVQGSSPVYDYS